MQQSSLLDIPPHIHVVETYPLPEINENIDPSKGRQEVFHLLDQRVLKVADVLVSVPYDDDIPPY